MRAAAFIAPLLVLHACAPAEVPPPAPLALDCALPFETLTTRIVAQPRLTPAPKAPREPYRFYSTADGKASWLITEPGADAHPAVMMQQAIGGEVKTTGCPYGDRKGFDELMAYLESLKTWRRKTGALDARPALAHLSATPAPWSRT